MIKIKVMVVSDDVDYRMKIKHLAECDEIEVCGYSEYNANTLLKITGFAPDVVVFGFANDDKLRFELAQEIYIKLKGCAFIMMNEVVDVAFMQKAMQVGIRLVFPDSVARMDLRKAIKESVEFERKRFNDENSKNAHCRVIGFFSGKGGVGKTAAAVNTALGLQMKGKKVLLIDADLQFGDANLNLDVEPKDTIAELVQEKEMTNPDVIRNFITLHSSGLGIICAPKSPEYAEYVTGKHIELLISAMRPYYDFIILDLASNLNDISISAAENSDKFILVCGQEISSLKSAKVCVNILDSLQLKEKTDCIIGRAYDKSMIKVKDFETVLGLKVVHIIPEDSKSMLACLNKGMPVINSGRTAAEIEFKKLCEKIISKTV